MKDTGEITTSSEDVKVIHVKIVGGNQADIYEIGMAMSELKKKLPYRLEAIVTNDKVELQDVDTLIKELYKLKKSIDTEKRLGKWEVYGVGEKIENY